VQVEERKNAHINELMKQHEAAFGEIKNYYNDITANNLDLIKVRSEDLHARWWFADLICRKARRVEGGTSVGT
jgi:ribulose 1,5-bisphosphate carboxylase large subunit-like protein